MVDKTLSKIIGAGGGLTTGDIVQTGRSVTADGRNLLPLGAEGRALSPAEQVANPELASVLEQRLVKTKGLSGIGNTGNSFFAAVNKCLHSGEGDVAYYLTSNISSPTPTGKGLQRVRRTQSSTTVYTNATTTIIAMDCSGDGSVVALVAKDSSNRLEASISVDYGDTFTTLEVDPSSSSTYYAEVSVSADGTMISIISYKGTSPNTSSFKLRQVLDTSAPLALTAAKILNLPQVPSIVQLALTDKAEAIAAFSYVSPPVNGYHHLYYSADGGDNFTELDLPAGGFYLDNSASPKVVLDRFHPSSMLLAGGQGGDVLYTVNAGTTWKTLPTPPDFNALGVPTEIETASSIAHSATWDFQVVSAALPPAILLSNNHLFITPVDGRVRLYYLGEAAEYLGPLTLTSTYEVPHIVGAGWNAAKTKVGYGFTFDSSVNDTHAMFGELTLSKYLPSVDTKSTGFKMIGDVL